MKLNVGCELCLLPEENGWINIDWDKKDDRVYRIDVRKGLNILDNSIDIVYGGNFFDHLDYPDAVRFMKECYRMLVDGGRVMFSVMDTDNIIEHYHKGTMHVFNSLQPSYFAEMDNATKFAVFLLGNLAGIPEPYTGHRMIYTIDSLIQLGRNTGFKVTKLTHTPDFTQEPWCVENPMYADHNIYVEYEK